ncbi:MAG: glycosyltransferase [Promethearchaeota archaeon]
MNLHVLQLSHFLPDWRVEKTIHSDIRLGNKISYVGLRVDNTRSIPNIHILNQSMHTALYRMNKFRRELKLIISNIDPDVIHAHDLVLARAALNLDYPLVYNDHEYHSRMEWANNPWTTPWTKRFLKRKFSWIYRYPIFRKWERELLVNSVVIVTHKNVALEYRKLGASVFVMPNQPEKAEVEKIRKQAQTCVRTYDGVYVGNDMSFKTAVHRQAHQAYAILKRNHKLLVVGDNNLESSGKVVSVGFVQHEMIYQYVMQAWTGLLAWKPHPQQYYTDTNKFYFYIHTGAAPIVPYTFDLVPFDHVLKFKNVHQIPALIEYAKKHFDPVELIENAKQYTWENQDDQLKQAYESILKKNKYLVN